MVGLLMVSFSMLMKRLILLGLIGMMLCGFKNEDIEFNKIASAIFYAEGGLKASRPYGIFYKGCSWDDPTYCRKICLNTIKNKYTAWLELNKKGPNSDFISYLASKYAPLSDSPLNRNWKRNVEWFLNHPKEVVI